MRHADEVVYPGVVVRWDPRKESFRFVYAIDEPGRRIIDAIDAALIADAYRLADEIFDDDQGDDVMLVGNERLKAIRLGQPLRKVAPAILLYDDPRIARRYGPVNIYFGPAGDFLRIEPRTVP